MPTLPIIVVGGGIGGIATALALGRQGRAVEILEQASDLRELGAGIQMPPNAFKAFAALGVLEPVQQIAAYPEHLILGDMLTGRPVFKAEIGAEFVRRFGFRYALMHRGDLLQILIDACRAQSSVRLRTNCRVTGFEDRGDRVIVRTGSGEVLEGTAMIAADGLWSATRETLFGDGLPQTDGFVVCRGVVPVSELPVELFSQTVTMWGGPELDLFHYPLRRGEIYNIGASYRDPRLRQGEPPPLNPKGDRALMHERFKSACPHVQRLLDYIDVSRAWVLYDRPPIRQWVKGRVALLGDAAHPTTIYISQGACMALEDAVVLAHFISLHASIADAFRAYQDARYLRTARIQLTSRQFGQAYHAIGVDRELRNHILTETPGSALYDTLAWVFGSPEQHTTSLGTCAT